MTRATDDIPGKRDFDHGVRPQPCKKISADAPIEVMPTPQQVSIPLLQHTGAPGKPVVKIKDEVTFGQMLAKADGFISAAIHSPIAGLVQKQSVATLPNGRHVATIPIKADGEQISGRQLFDEIYGGDWPVDGLGKYEPNDITQAIRDAGVVGLGGAAFPTHVKFAVKEDKHIDTILVNGCECEPYLTADYRLMLEAPEPIITGSRLAARACGAKRVLIAIEDNKPKAIKSMRIAAADTDVIIAVMHTKYPMGGERQTIKAALDREVPTGGLPLDVGVVVINVGTAGAIARAVVRGGPLTHRIVTVTGAGIENPKNLLVPVGISYQELIDYCGGLKSDAVRVISGGPMMGFTIGDLSAPVTKGTSGITILTKKDVSCAAETHCIHCGRCVDACPLHLVPAKIHFAAKHKDWELAKKYQMLACIECGCCAYECPASIPLVQLIRTGKSQMPRE